MLPLSFVLSERPEVKKLRKKKKREQDSKEERKRKKDEKRRREERIRATKALVTELVEMTR